MIKTILTLVYTLALMLNIGCSANKTAFENALELQKVNHKPIMLNISSSHCGYCKRMDRDVFGDKQMARWLDDRFIIVKLDKMQDTIPLGVKVDVTPTFVFIKNSRVIKTIPGAWNIEDFKSLTKEIK